jgi:hypothetical protein
MKVKYFKNFWTIPGTDNEWIITNNKLKELYKKIGDFVSRYSGMDCSKVKVKDDNMAKNLS